VLYSKAKPTTVATFSRGSHRALQEGLRKETDAQGSVPSISPAPREQLDAMSLPDDAENTWNSYAIEENVERSACGTVSRRMSSI